MTKKTSYLLFFCLTLLLLVKSDESIDPYLISRFLVFSVFTAVAALVFYQRKKEFSLSPFHWIFISFIAYSCLSALWAINTPDALLENFNLLSAFLFSVLLHASFRENQDENILLKILLSAIVLTELFALYTLYDLYHTQFETFQGIYSITANMAHKNLVSCFLAATLPFSLWSLYSLKNFWRYVASAALGIALFFIVLLQSRSVWLGLTGFFLLLIAAFTWLKLWSEAIKKTKEIIAPALSGLILFIALTAYVWSTKPFVFNEGADHLQSVVEQSEKDKSNHTASIYERYFLWDNTVSMIKEHGTLGVGAGSWKFFFPKYGVQGSRAEEGFTVFQRPHNDFLWIAAELGIIGFGLLLTLIGFIFVRTFKSLRSNITSGTKLKIIFLSGTLIVLFTDSLFSFPKERSELVVLALLSIAWLLYYCKTQDKTFSPKLFLLSAGIMALISVGYYKRWQGEKTSYKMIVDHAQGRLEKLPRMAKSAESFIYNTDPFLSPVCWYAGIYYYNQGDSKEALSAFGKAVEIHPYHLHSLDNLAGAYVLAGDNKMAEHYYLEALKISPYYDEVLINLSSIYYNNKDYQKAFTTLQKCPPATEHPNYKRNAVAIYKKILEAKGNTEDIKNPDKVLELFKQSVGIRPSKL
ncbi:MAG: O-antigen ligase family protein [Flavobacteriales bacterium]